jgi:hypothetical protein
MKKLKTLFGFSLFVLFCWQTSAVIAAPQVGWWWNPAESGRGFFIESQNGVTFLGAYFYDTDGHATWLVAGGQNDDPYNYTGPLYAASGGQPLFGTYIAPQGSAVGTVSVHFSDDTHGTLTWPGGTVAIERQIFGGTGAVFQPFSGWWWNTDESGSGYSVELQGDKLFIVGFMYDDGGRPVWYFSAGPMTDDTTYSGTVLQFANGQTMSGPYKPPGPPATVATLDVQFTASNEATLTFSEASAARGDKAKAGRSRTIRATTEFARVPFYIPPRGFTGTLVEDAIGHSDDGGLIIDLRYTVSLNLVFEQTNDEPDIYKTYKITGGIVTVTEFYTSVGDGLSCIASGTRTVGLSLVPAFSHNLDVATGLLASAFQHYSLIIHLAAGQLPFDGTATCTDEDGTTTESYMATNGAFDFDYEGPIVRDTIRGGGRKMTSIGPISYDITYQVNLTGTR